MAYYLSPVLNDQQFDSNGDPLAGGLIYTYLTQTTTPETTYKTSLGVAHTNPIVLDSSGNLPTGTQLWLSGTIVYTFVVKTSVGVTLRTIDNISGVNDAIGQQSEWVNYTSTAITYLSATSFSLAGDQTSIFTVGRRIKSINSGGTVYSRISASVYGSVTTVTLVNDSGSLDAGLSAVYYGLLDAVNPSLPNSSAVRTAMGVAASGANADITSMTALASVNGGPIAGIRNRLINGAMAIDQRNAGASKTFTAAAALSYCVDQWFGYCTGANVTGQRVAGSSQSHYRYQFTGAASVSAIGFGQRMEALNTYDCNSQTCTFGVDIANSLLTTVTWTAYYANTTNTFGSIAVPTKTQIATGTFTVTSTVTRYSAQISVPAAAITGIEILLTVGAQTSGTWTIGNAQWEIGSVATTFERKPASYELASCQRHYFKTFPQATAPAQNAGTTGALNSTMFVSGSGIYSLWTSFPTTMFSTPTMTTYNPSAANAQIRNVTAAADYSNTTTVSRESGVEVHATTNGSTGNAIAVHVTAESVL